MPLFFPPTVDEGPAAHDVLFYRYKLPRGISVLKENSRYYLTRVPSTDEIDDAEEYYVGGHTHEISEETKTELLNANIGLTEDNFA